MCEPWLRIRYLHVAHQMLADGQLIALGLLLDAGFNLDHRAEPQIPSLVEAIDSWPLGRLWLDFVLIAFRSRVNNKLAIALPQIPTPLFHSVLDFFSHQPSHRPSHLHNPSHLSIKIMA